MKKFNHCLLVCLLALFAGCEKHSSDEVAALEGSAAVVELISPEETSELLKANEGVRILDIRTPEEFSEGHIEGAVNIDYKADNFDEEIGLLDKSVPYVVHCASGGRSGQSLPKFENSGFEKIYHLKAGFSGWADEGLPVSQ
ncbi:rhodanese-like domain-containing protein [Verrucomicrobiales bacterium BCK34]|nr:rhodanese-like domain-containing protein [Verrucomicrobiales bacterium BCK34]